jgi:hypothetical protein
MLRQWATVWITLCRIGDLVVLTPSCASFLRQERLRSQKSEAWIGRRRFRRSLPTVKPLEIISVKHLAG